MADTKIADVIVPEVFNPYVWQRTVELTRMRMGGIVSNDAELNRLAEAGGSSINMPFWNDLEGDDEILSDSDALDPAKITAGQDKAVLHMRGKAWAVNDLAASLAGDDPIRGAADLVANYWVRKQQSVMISSLQGVFADNVANDGSDMVLDIGIADGNNAAEANLFSGEAFIDAEATFGDAINSVVGVGVHSVIYNRMKKLGLIEFIPDDEAKGQIATFQGKRVIVDDTCKRVAGGTSGFKYTSYLFGNGAIGYGEGRPKTPTENDRDSLAGVDYLITRRHFLLHPRGIKFTNSSVAGAAPTNAELEAAGNWDRVYNRKMVRIAGLITNG